MASEVPLATDALSHDGLPSGCAMVEAARVVEEDQLQTSSSSTARPGAAVKPDAWADAAEAMRAAKEHWDIVLGFVAPCMQSYAGSMRPWGEFAILMMQTPETMNGLQDRLERNFSYFQANYMMLVVAAFGFMIFVHPAYLAAAAIMVGAWSAYLVRGGLDPQWKPVVWGVELTSMHRLMLLSAGSLLVLFLVIGEMFFVMAGALSVLIVFHAAFHPGTATDMARSSMEFCV